MGHARTHTLNDGSLSFLQDEVQGGGGHLVRYHHRAGLRQTRGQCPVPDDSGHPLHCAAHHRAKEVSTVQSHPQSSPIPQSV